MSETPEEPTYVERVLTCGSEGCANAGSAITLAVPDDCASFVCGACGQTIEDVS